jgi:hypothetical protein
LRVPGGIGGKMEYSVSIIGKNIQTKGEIFLCDDNGISIISDIVSYCHIDLSPFILFLLRMIQ